MKPVRIRRKRTKGWRMPANTVYVGRPTKWGNPFRTGDVSEEVSYYRLWLDNNIPMQLEADFIDVSWKRQGGYMISRSWEELDELRKEVLEQLPELRGKNLACWCPLDQPCHADILLELANATNKPQ